MVNTAEYDKAYAEKQLQRSRHPLRRVVKNFYLNNILRDVIGPTIDFGCGAGQLLRRLPAGSIGLEVNPYLVSELRNFGMNVMPYDPEVDQFFLRDLPTDRFKTFAMAHVLEHFEEPDQILHKICKACGRLGVQRVILIVPGEKGFSADRTHKTFCNYLYFDKHGLLSCEGYEVCKTEYFPVNLEVIGRYFTFHEFKVVYDRIALT